MKRRRRMIKDDVPGEKSPNPPAHVEVEPQLPTAAENPKLAAAAKVIGEIIWQYVTTHTAEECEALQRRVEQGRIDRERLYGKPQAIVKPPAS